MSGQLTSSAAVLASFSLVCESASKTALSCRFGTSDKIARSRGPTCSIGLDIRWCVGKVQHSRRTAVRSDYVSSIRNRHGISCRLDCMVIGHRVRVPGSSASPARASCTIDGAVNEGAIGGRSIRNWREGRSLTREVRASQPRSKEQVNQVGVRPRRLQGWSLVRGGCLTASERMKSNPN